MRDSFLGRTSKAHASIVGSESGLRITVGALCVPSMGENQRGFKSLVYRMKIKKGLSEANCGRATDRGKEG